MSFLRRRDPHARFLELLSLQLDEPLPLDDAWQLSLHLARCQRCRAAERDYREHRRALRALADLDPPRDLGARVSAALDREVLRSPGLPGGGRVLWPAGPAMGRPSVAGTSAVVSLAVLAVGAIAVLSGLPLALPDATRLRPTPLAVPNQPLAFLGAGPEGFALYRTAVDQVCPVSALDCVEPPDERAMLALSRPMRPSSLALSPSGERLVISARDSDSQEDVFAVVLMPPAIGPSLGDTQLATASPARPAVPDEPTSPAATLGPTAPDSSATASAPSEPGWTTEPTSPAVTATPGGPAATVAPTAEPLLSPSAGDPLGGLLSPVSTDAALTMVAILQDVHAAGAAPAWSADGGVLAFSAMPADGSHGPDIYIWRPGDDAARPITTDHASYFASWSGDRVVASRVGTGDEVTGGAAAGADIDIGVPPAATQPAITTVLIDPLSGAESVLSGPSLWLPQVSREQTRAVAWHGRLQVVGTLVRPVEGALYVLDWTLLDPFAERITDDPLLEPANGPSHVSPSPYTAPPAGTGPPQVDPTEPGGLPRDEYRLLTLPPVVESPSGGGDVSGEPSEQPKTDSREPPEASGDPPGGASPSSVPAEPSDPSAAPAEPSSAPAAVALMPLEPERDVESAPVLDWEVRWAPDGTALGFWIADVPGASWGRLAVLPVDEAGDPQLASPLLPPTLARRSFTLGLNRVAWVAPTDATPEGELRISVWGPGGPGMLRFSDPDLYGVLAAF